MADNLNSFEKEVQQAKKAYEKALWLYVQGYMTDGEYNKVRKRINEEIILINKMASTEVDNNG